MQLAALLMTPHGTATETWSRERPTLTPARSIDARPAKTANGGAAGFFPP